MTLKPCPFCMGGEAKFALWTTDKTMGCQNCGALGPPGQNDEEARKNWNTRVIDAENERLRGVIAAIIGILKSVNKSTTIIMQARLKCREALEGKG